MVSKIWLYINVALQVFFSGLGVWLIFFASLIDMEEVKRREDLGSYLSPMRLYKEGTWYNLFELGPNTIEETNKDANFTTD